MTTIDEKLNAHRQERLTDTSELAVIPDDGVTVAQFNSAAVALRNTDPIRYASLQRQLLQKYVSSQMVEGSDYGRVKGIPQPFLFKQGAEKLASLFNLGVTVEGIRQVEDFDKPFFYFVYKAVVRDRHNFVISECEGSCNSKERGYQSDRVDIYAAVNSIMKKAEKRAYVGAVLLACNASSFFAQPTKEANISLPDDRPTIDAEIVDQSPEPQKITAAQRSALNDIATEAGHSADSAKALLATLGIKSSKDVTTDQYEMICSQLGNQQLAQMFSQQTQTVEAEVA